jgi:sulfatase maturation enzyme AslB (radical SAM superfamily)
LATSGDASPIELVEKYRRPDQVVEHTFQTNGILLDDEWTSFFKEHNFLVGLRVDGPRELHDAYRVDRSKQGTFDKIMKGWSYLRKHGIEFKSPSEAFEHLRISSVAVLTSSYPSFPIEQP